MTYSPDLIAKAVAMCQSMNYPGDTDEDLMRIVSDVAYEFNMPWGVVEQAWNAAIEADMAKIH